MRLPVDVPAAAGRPFIELAREIAVAILTIVDEGWQLALTSSNVGSGDYEVQITERLRDGMREAANARALGVRLAVLPGTESRSRPEMSRPDGRTDIPILVIEVFLRFGEHDPHAIIECKRIAGSDAQLCRQYVVEGIDRFRTGKYGENHSTGFMVGYLLVGDANGAAAGINRYLNGRSRAHEELRPSDLFATYWAWRSEHPRGSGLRIELHHAFLAFVEAPPG